MPQIDNPASLASPTNPTINPTSQIDPTTSINQMENNISAQSTDFHKTNNEYNTFNTFATLDAAAANATPSQKPITKRKTLPFTLDFTINDAQERAQYIGKLMATSTHTFTEKELDLLSLYLLYGKDATDGKNPVQRHEISIDTKYKKQRTRATASLNELMESPGFNELTSFNTTSTHYTAPKPNFSREANEEIAQLHALWDNIDYYQQLVDMAEGRFSMPENPNAALTAMREKALAMSAKQLYEIKHMLIEMRKEQYTIRDCFKPIAYTQKNGHHSTYFGVDQEDCILWDTPDSNYAIAPLGLYLPGAPRFEHCTAPLLPDYTYNKQAQYILDFRNPEHIYQLIEHYWSLMGDESVESLPAAIARTLDFYVSNASLKPEYQMIYDMKLAEKSNKEIQETVNMTFGKNHTVNYISTIYKQKVCKAIADAAAYHYDCFLARNQPEKWKVCRTCGRRYLRDTRNFVRKARSLDALANRCKECDRMARQGVI